MHVYDVEYDWQVMFDLDNQVSQREKQRIYFRALGKDFNHISIYIISYLQVHFSGPAAPKVST